MMKLSGDYTLASRKARNMEEEVSERKTLDLIHIQLVHLP